MSRPSAFAVPSSRADRNAVLLVQLGTPDAPTAAAVRRYLAQFLSDPRVVEIPPAVWRPILHGIVLRLRPRRSAARYAAVWTAEGSPLAVYSERQAAGLRAALAQRGLSIEVALAMRYGEPSLPRTLRALRDRGLERLLVVPMYPQYSASTTATVYDALAAEFAGWRELPELRIVKDFHDDPGYIEALARRIEDAWQRDGPSQRLVLSFHGIPRRAVELGDPYRDRCLATASLLARRLGLRDADWIATFQSRFGRAEWLRPYTDETLAELGASRTARVDVVCPGFVADCLETLEEIAIEGRARFLQAGGGEFRYIGCLNDSPAFVDALRALVERHLAGWPAAASRT